MQVGAATREVQSLTFHGKNPSSDLNWLGENLRSFDQATMVFVHCSVLGGVEFLESLEFRCCSDGGCIIAARAGISDRDFLFLSFIFTFFGLCAIVLPLRYYVVAGLGVIDPFIEKTLRYWRYNFQPRV
jgi:hypothetical protein